MYVMITTANCPRCEASKRMLTEHNLIGQVQCIPINDPKGVQYAKDYRLTVAGAEILSTEDHSKMTVAEFICSMEGESDA